MSFSDRIGQSIFCQKVGKTRPMRKKMDGKAFSPERLAKSTLIFNNASTFPSLFFDMACKHLCSLRMKKQKSEKRKYAELRKNTYRILGIRKIISLRCRTKLRVEWHKNFLWSSKARKGALWVLYLDWINFFWAHKPRLTPTIRTRSEDIPDIKQRKPGNEWGLLPE